MSNPFAYIGNIVGALYIYSKLKGKKSMSVPILNEEQTKEDIRISNKKAKEDGFKISLLALCELISFQFIPDNIEIKRSKHPLQIIIETEKGQFVDSMLYDLKNQIIISMTIGYQDMLLLAQLEIDQRSVDDHSEVKPEDSLFNYIGTNV